MPPVWSVSIVTLWCVDLSEGREGAILLTEKRRQALRKLWGSLLSKKIIVAMSGRKASNQLPWGVGCEEKKPCVTCRTFYLLSFYLFIFSSNLCAKNFALTGWKRKRSSFCDESLRHCVIASRTFKKCWVIRRHKSQIDVTKVLSHCVKNVLKVLRRTFVYNICLQRF